MHKHTRAHDYSKKQMKFNDRLQSLISMYGFFSGRQLQKELEEDAKENENGDETKNADDEKTKEAKQGGTIECFFQHLLLNFIEFLTL